MKFIGSIRYLVLAVMLMFPHVVNADNGAVIAAVFNGSTMQIELRSYDITTGEYTLLNASAFDSGFWNYNTLSADLQNNMLYALSSNKLYEFDPTTGSLIRTQELNIDMTSSLQNLRPRDNNPVIGVVFNGSTMQIELRSYDRSGLGF